MNSRMVKIEKVKDISQLITKGTTPTTLGKNYLKEGIRFLRVQNLFNGKVNYFPDDLFIDDETDKLLSRSRIKPGDVLVSIAGTIGTSAIVEDSCGLLNCNQAVAIIRLEDQIDRRY